MLLWTLLLSAFVVADTFGVTRTSSQSGNWSASATWGGNPAPVSGDDVIINGGFTVTVDLPNAACLSIQLGGSALGQGTGTLSFAGGSQLTVSGGVSVGPFNNNNTAGSLSMASGGTLVCEGLIVGRLGTWTAGTGTIELTTTNSIPSDNNIIFDNLTVSGGTTSLTRNTSVNGNLTINPGATLTGGANTLTVGGDWINNGTFTGSAGTVTFIKNGNPTIAGTGVNNFNLMRMNLGASISNTLEVLSTHFNAPDAFLTITNGTFKVSGTFTFASTFITGPIYNIDPTAGLWINNPNVTVTAQAGGVSVRGLLRLSAGTYNIGTSIDNSLNYVTGSTIIIEGGTLHIAGLLTRNNATATTSYTQSGGTVSMVEQGSTDPVFAGFDLGAVGSSFSMSGGTIVVRNATSASADYVNASSAATVTGGTLQLGDANTGNAQVFRIQTSRPVGNLLISNATSQATKPIAQLTTSSLNIVGNVTIQAGTTLNANGLNVSLGGDWSNSGNFTAGPTVTFNGSGAQGMTTVSGETYNALAINKAGGTLTLNSSATVNGTFALTQGTLAVNGSVLTFNSTVTGGGTLTSTNTGTVNYNQGSDGQNVLTGSYGNLVFSNFSKTLASSGGIGISGTFTPGSASGHTVAGSTIDFNGGSQNIPAFTYNNLTMSGGGTKTGPGTLTVGGSLTNNSGVVFSGISTLNLNGAAHLNNGTLNVATLSVGSGATLTNNGTITSTSALTGVGTFMQGATGTLNLGGTVDITTLNNSAVGNTINYTGAGQTVRAATYHSLTLSGSGTPVLTGISTINGNLTFSGTVTPVAATGMTIGGNFTVGAGTSFDAGSFSHVLKGNWSNSGTFNAGTSTFTLNGSSAQTMSGSTFSNLVIDNASGVSMLTDETVTNTLTLTSGVLATGTHKIIVTNSAPGSVVITSGSVNGQIDRAIAAGSSGTYLFTDLNTQLIPNGSQSAIVASIKSFPNTIPPNIGGGAAVNRYYTITPTGSLTATIRLAYLAGEINGIPEGSMTLFRSSGIVWALVPSTTNPVNKYVQTATAVSQFSNWTIGDVDTPLPIQLASFTGTMVNGPNTLLTWVTLSEVNNFGFNVQRKRPSDPEFIEVPGSFIPGNGTTNEPHTYSFTDIAPGLGTWLYRLKQMDLDGSIHYSEPIQIDVVTGVNEESQPLTYALEQNYPNPFNPSTTIKFEVPQNSLTTLRVYNLLGAEVATLVNAEMKPGSHEVKWNPSGQASGLYFYRLKAGSFTETKRMVLLK